MKKVKPTTLKPIGRNVSIEKKAENNLTKFTLSLIRSFTYWTLATVNKNINKNIATQLVFNFNDLLKDWNKKTNEFAKKEALKQTKEIRNHIDLGLKKQNVEFNLKTTPKDVQNSLNAIYQRNYNLIKTIPQDIKERFEQVFLNDINNFDQEAILKQISTIEGISKRRAKTIARDQTQKALDSYNATRETNLGFEYYVWETSLDERVSTGKGGHKYLEGRIFRYDTASAVIDDYGNVGHPSQRVNCRCRRRALLLKPNQEVKLVKDSTHGDYYVLVEKS